MALRGLIGRLLAPRWSFASDGLTSRVFLLAQTALYEALAERLGQEESKAVYHAFVASLAEAVGATVHMRLCIQQTLRSYYMRGQVQDNFQLRKTLVSFADMRFTHRFTGLLLRLGTWTDLDMTRAVATVCALHAARRGHKVPEYLLKAHECAMDRHYLAHMLCQFPASEGTDGIPNSYTVDEHLPVALMAWVPRDIPEELRQRMAKMGGYVHEEGKGNDEPAAVSGRFAPSRICLWNLCEDAGGVEVQWLRTLLTHANGENVGPVECADQPPEGLAHVVALLCAPASTQEALALAEQLASRVRDGTETLVVLMLSPTDTEPVDSMEPCLRYTDQLGLCLADGLRRRGLFSTRVHLEMVWSTGSNAPVQTLLRDGDTWWRREAETASNPMVRTFLAARFGPWTAGLLVHLPSHIHEGVRHDLLALINDASLCRVALTKDFQPHHTVVVLSSLATHAERESYRAQHLSQHTGRVVWLVVLPTPDACASCGKADPDVATLCGVPDDATQSCLELPSLLSVPCNVRALQILRGALGGMDD